MALTVFQERVCRLIASHRLSSGESYIAGGAALNLAVESTRLSRDVDLFHDTEEALSVTWERDRAAFETQGYGVEVVRERPAFVEAVVSGTNVAETRESVVLQWTRDSAFRFFPLVEHPVFGLALHPFDLATNKVLALAGRLEVRDWVDLIACHRALQPLGFLAWAACGKDPGFSPGAILEEAARSSRYTQADVSALDFAGPPPDAATLGREWHAMLREAETLIALLPPEHVGEAVLTSDGSPFRGDAETLQAALQNVPPSESVALAASFHPGAIRGAFPHFK